MIKKFMKGNEALVYAADLAGANFFAGYPITPSSEVPELAIPFFLSKGKVAIQMESEAAVGFALYGAGAAGALAFTATSGPGMGWLQDSINYMSTAEVPAVIVDIMRGGPALGNIAPSQADYREAVEGGGNGDYRAIVLAPSSVQELVDLTYKAFGLAQDWRIPVIVLGDGLMGQMKESVVLPEPVAMRNIAPWALTGAEDREPNRFIPFDLEPEGLERMNARLQAKFREIEKNEKYFELVDAADPEVLVVAFGTAARICKSAVKKAAAEGIKARLFRPISLWPFPEEALRLAANGVKKVLVVEMNCGQMLKDVRLALGRDTKIEFYGRPGGVVPGANEILGQIKAIACKKNWWVLVKNSISSLFEPIARLLKRIKLAAGKKEV
jgi:2-oxoglutarate/2-oxoacid ferredoxin oxidoreductase subunit alpha